MSTSEFTRFSLTSASSAAKTDAAPEPEKSLLQYLGVALSGVFFVLVLSLAATIIVIPALVGGTAFTVLTQSMEPRLPPGTLIVVRPTPVDKIRIGNVLTYQITSGNPAVVSHRVVSKTIESDGTTTFITKGDNNDLADAKPVREVQIRGTLWYNIPWLGYVNNAVHGDARSVVVPAIAGALLLYALAMAASSAIERRRKKRRTLSV